MTTEQSTTNNTLPISFTPLVAFDGFTKVQRKVLQSVVMAMPPQYLPTDPSAQLFQPPIQVVVLGIKDEQVELGIYYNDFLQLQQGPPPNAQWVERWKQK